MHEIFQRISQLKIVPVLTVDDADNAAPLGDALFGGGLPIAEITFRTAAAESVVRALSRRSDLLVGAGTILNVQTAQIAVDAGAQFLVAPGFNPKVVRWCVDHGIPIMPGAATPTDIDMAVEYALDVVKFFPAQPLGGIKMLQAIAAPFAMMRFFPTGSITPENLDAYLKFDRVIAVGGSWMASRELLAEKDFTTIRELTQSAVQLVERLRPAERNALQSPWQRNEVQGRR